MRTVLLSLLPLYSFSSACLAADRAKVRSEPYKGESFLANIRACRQTANDALVCDEQLAMEQGIRRRRALMLTRLDRMEPRT